MPSLSLERNHSQRMGFFLKLGCLKKKTRASLAPKKLSGEHQWQSQWLSLSFHGPMDGRCDDVIPSNKIT